MTLAILHLTSMTQSQTPAPSYDEAQIQRATLLSQGIRGQVKNKLAALTSKMQPLMTASILVT
jgi:hypothetical protein